MSRKPFGTIWKVSIDDPNDTDEDRGEDILFTNERAGRVFARWAKKHWPVVVGPWESAIYSSGSFAVKMERDNAPGPSDA